MALTIPGPLYFQMTLAVLWLMAFASASHDIAADGFYMLALPMHSQAAFVGVRSTFYRLAQHRRPGRAGLFLAGPACRNAWGDMKTAWTVVFFLLCGLFLSARRLSPVHAAAPAPATARPPRAA